MVLGMSFTINEDNFLSIYSVPSITEFQRTYKTWFLFPQILHNSYKIKTHKHESTREGKNSEKPVSRQIRVVKGREEKGKEGRGGERKGRERRGGEEGKREEERGGREGEGRGREERGGKNFRKKKHISTLISFYYFKKQVLWSFTHLSFYKLS